MKQSTFHPYWRWFSSDSLSKNILTKLCFDFKTFTPYFTLFIDLKFFIWVIITKNINILIAAILTHWLRHFRTRNHDLSTSYFAFNEFFWNLWYNDIDNVVFLSLISKSIRLKVIAVNVTTTMQPLVYTFGTLIDGLLGVIWMMYPYSWWQRPSTFSFNFFRI